MKNSVKNLLELKNHKLSLKLSPSFGACFLGFSAKIQDKWVDIMRPSDPEKVSVANDCANYLMLPYPNRIKDGKFVFQGQAHQLRNPENHSIHGDVSERVWKVLSQSSEACVLNFDSRQHNDINFPFSFAAEFSLSLQDSKLTAKMKVQNTGTQAMPFGYGHHPYFLRSLSISPNEKAKVQVECEGTYPFEGTIPLPTNSLGDCTPENDLRKLRELNIWLDHCYGGWKQKSVIEWPQSQVKLSITGDSAFTHFVVYSPTDKPFFAFEQQTMMNDGFNFYERGEKGTGVIVLGVGEEHQSETSWEVVI